MSCQYRCTLSLYVIPAQSSESPTQLGSEARGLRGSSGYVGRRLTRREVRRRLGSDYGLCSTDPDLRAESKKNGGAGERYAGYDVVVGWIECQGRVEG